MRSNLIRIILISFLLVLFIPNLTFAKTKTVIKEKTFQAKEDNSKNLELLLEANRYIDNLEYDKAIISAGTIIKKKGVDSGDLVHAYVIIGFAYKQKGLFIEAIKAFQKVETIKSDSAFVPLSYQYLGRTYVDMKMYKKAIPEFEKAISILNKIKEGYIKTGQYDYDRIFGLGSFQRAIDDNDVKLAENWMWVATTHFSETDKPKGVADGDDWVKIPNETVAAFKKILEIKPYSDDIFERVELLLRSQKDSSDILAWCDKLIKRYPNNSKMYLARGRTYLSSEKYQQAISDFSKSIELNDQNPEPYKLRGIVFSLIGNSEMAVKDFDTAIGMEPSDATLYNLRGQVSLQTIKTTKKDGKLYYLKKDEEQARKAFTDITTAARLGDKDAQDYLKNQGIKW